MKKDPNRKTTIPVQGIPEIIKYILTNCNAPQLEFMASLAANKQKFAIFQSILSLLTEKNVYDVFYEKSIGNKPEDLMVFRASKRGEVAGLKAFEKACQLSYEEISRRKPKKEV